MALSIAGFALLPDHPVAILALVVVFWGLFLAYTGRPLRGRSFTAVGAITLANGVVFVLQGIPLDARLPIIPSWWVAVVTQDGFVPAAFVHGQQWWAPVTQMFVHSDALHIVFNMLFLWFIGPRVEERTGRRRFVLMYLATGFAATAATVLGVLYLPPAWQSIVWLNLPDWSIPNIGASGAVYGVIGFAIGAFPREKVLVPVFIPILLSPPVAAVVLVVANVLFTLGSNTAWWAHLAGMFLGILVGIVWRLKGPRQPIEAVAEEPSGDSATFGFTYREP